MKGWGKNCSVFVGVRNKQSRMEEADARKA